MKHRRILEQHPRVILQLLLDPPSRGHRHVVDDDVDHEVHVAGVEGVAQGFEVGGGTEAGVEGGGVLEPVAGAGGRKLARLIKEGFGQIIYP